MWNIYKICVDYWVNPGLCADHKSYCSSCAKAATSTVTLAFFGLLSMMPQMLVNLQRSTGSDENYMYMIL